MRPAIVISCEHASNATGDFAHLFTADLQVLSTHRGYDLGAVEVAELMAARLQSPMIKGSMSRLVIELNRTLENPQLYSEFSASISETQRQQLTSDYYLPYREKLEALISEGIEQKGQCLHLSIHSFTPIFDNVVRKHDLGLLFDPAREGDSQFCENWLQSLRLHQPTLSSAPNFPYLGTDDGLTTYFRKVFSPDRYMGIEVEINQLHAKKSEMLGDWLCSSLEDILAD